MKYREIKCSSCSGKGIVSKYSMTDFEGPDECNDCFGSGNQIIYENGTIAKYYGGPLCGKLTIKELKAYEI